ncbi:MAG: nitroreductase/quinone reductase family protein [Pseudomonadales bacterium]
MKVPEFMFVIVNPIVALLLRSPLHFLASKSLMVVTFWGRKSGKQYSTPVRYLRYEETIVSFSSDDTAWWRNLREGAKASLLVQGSRIDCTTTVIEHDAEKVREWLDYYFKQFPQDMAYHDVKLKADGLVDEATMAVAVEHAIVMIATPVA